MEIEREENIFYNLIKNETSLTEVFCNFMKYKIFRDLFIDIVNEKIKNKESTIDKSKVRFEDFDTEVPLKEDEEKLGRIDLQLKVSDEIYLFEIKIEAFTSLTDNQPKSYLEFLKNNNLYKNENLFFILPKGYFHKNEIYESWEEKTKYSKKEIENHNIIYWEDILKLLRKQELDKANVFINELCKILDFRWFYFEKIIFTKSELDLMFSDKKEKGYKMLENMSIPKLISNLYKIIDELPAKFFTKYNKEFESYEYNGYFLDNNKYKLSNKFKIWFGVDNVIWENTQNPISIQIVGFEIDDIENLEKYLVSMNCFNNEKSEINFKIFKYEDNTICFYVQLEKNIFENQDENIVEELITKINRIIDLLRNYQ